MQKDSLNTGKAVDFNSITDIKRAAHDFSESNKELEQLLLNCFENKIATNSCCAGHRETGQKPYVSFKFRGNKRVFDNLLLQLSESGYEFRYIKETNGLSHFQVQEGDDYDFSYPTLLFSRLKNVIAGTGLNNDYFAQLPRDLQEYSKIIDSCENDKFLDGPAENNLMQMCYTKNANRHAYGFFTSDAYYENIIKRNGFQKPDDNWLSPYQVVTQDKESVTESLKRIREEVQVSSKEEIKPEISQDNLDEPLFVYNDSDDRNCLVNEIYVLPGMSVEKIAQQLWQLKNRDVLAKAVINGIELNNINSSSKEQIVHAYKDKLEEKKMAENIQSLESQNKEYEQFLGLREQQRQQDQLLRQQQLGILTINSNEQLDGKVM